MVMVGVVLHDTSDCGSLTNTSTFPSNTYFFNLFLPLLISINNKFVKGCRTKGV